MCVYIDVCMVVCGWCCARTNVCMLTCVVVSVCVLFCAYVFIYDYVHVSLYVSFGHILFVWFGCCVCMCVHVCRWYFSVTRDVWMCRCMFVCICMYVVLPVCMMVCMCVCICVTGALCG